MLVVVDAILDLRDLVGGHDPEALDIIGAVIFDLVHLARQPVDDQVLVAVRA